VEAGESFTITNRGKPIADLVPSRSTSRLRCQTAIANQEYAEDVQDSLLEANAWVPNLWHLEATNVLLAAEKRGGQTLQSRSRINIPFGK
jgi:antitoxin (DNA-binding transcriptional repressor) of toxin-antitoxin stability system